MAAARAAIRPDCGDTLMPIRESAPPQRFIFAAGCISACLAVALGAFAAHALKARLAADMLGVFEVGVRYQMYHAFALIAAAWSCTRWPGRAATAAGWLFLVGTLIFSGSLYVLSLTGLRWAGAITPLGGAAFIAGWLVLAWSPFASCAEP
jgi:uncharacterized membrane protein YgdD (TMEM256/DUF423 family)